MAYQIKVLQNGKTVGTRGPYANKEAAVRAAQPIADANGSAAKVMVCKVAAKARRKVKKTKASKAKTKTKASKTKPRRRRNPGEALAAKAAQKAMTVASAAAARAARQAGAHAAQAGSKYLSETAQQLAQQQNPRRRNPISPDVDGFLMHLRGGLTQYDMRENKKHPNIYRLGHLFAALERVRQDLAGRGAASDPQSLAMLKQSIGTRFILKGMPPARKTIKAIDDFLATGKAPKYPVSKPTA